MNIYLYLNSDNIERIGNKLERRIQGMSGGSPEGHPCGELLYQARVHHVFLVLKTGVKFHTSTRKFVR